MTGDEQSVPEQDARQSVDIPQAPTTVHYQMVNTPEQLADCLKQVRQAEVVAFDTETNSLDPMHAKLVGMSFSVEVGQGWYIPLAHSGNLLDEQLDKQATLAEFASWFSEPNA